MVDDPVAVAHTLHCFPDCVKKMLAPCYGQGTCKELIFGGTIYTQQGNDIYANCIVKIILAAFFLMKEGQASLVIPMLRYVIVTKRALSATL